MTRRSKILLTVVSFGVAVLLILAAIQIHKMTEHKVILTDEEVRQIILRDLPPGTRRSVVKHFLDGKGWNYSDSGSTTQTMVRDAEHDFLIRTDIQIQFHFDSENKLVSYSLMDFHTGP